MSIAETDLTGAGQRMLGSTEASDVCSREKSNVLDGSSSLTDFRSRPHTSGQPVELANVALPKVNDKFLVLDFVSKFIVKKPASIVSGICNEALHVFQEGCVARLIIRHFFLDKKQLQKAFP